jgi:hypothetical protein
VTRKRAIIVYGTTAFLILAGAALLLSSSSEVPHVRLVNLSALDDATGNLEAHLQSQDTASTLLSGVPDVASAPMAAQFEISVSREKGYALAPEPVLYGFRGAGGTFIGSGSWEFPVIFTSQARCPSAFRPRLTVPAGTESVHLLVRYKEPTIQERSMMTFEKSGLRKRYSKACDWISRLLPNKEHWMIYETDVKLVPSPREGPTEK